MKAIVYDRFGGPDVLRVAELPRPATDADSVLIRVKAAAVNPADIAIREGALSAAVDTYFPVIPGWDVAGIVEHAGPGAPEFAPGDEVIAYTRSDTLRARGAYAELVAVDVRAVATKPRNLDWVHSAALPLAGLTAYQAITKALRVSEGDTILVHGASGAVGSMATQIAVALGAEVIGTTSVLNYEYVKTLGASPVNYRDDVVEQVRTIAPAGIDAILHTAGSQALASTDAVGTGAVRVATIAGGDHHRAVPVFVRMDSGDLRSVVDLAEKGLLLARIGQTLPLEEASTGHRLLASGHTSGKIVLTVD